MKYLLDTHFLIWAVGGSKRLSRKIKETITDPANQIFVSVISFWEISLKTSLGKVVIKGIEPNELAGFCEQMGFFVAPLSAKESTTYHQLTAMHHKDPFDKMIVWQAISNDYILITEDENILKYVSSGLKVLTQS